jgi:AcrR family transcriptional regulator
LREAIDSGCIVLSLQTDLSEVVESYRPVWYSQPVSKQALNRPQRPAASASSRLSARERLLAAADELFYGGGINLVGIDRVIEHAGVAKASLYDCFGSKEELIRSYLQARNEIRQARIRDRLSRHTTPLDKILSIFELQAEVVAQPNFRGCAFLRAGADADEGGKIKQVCDQSRAFVRMQFTELAREAGVRDPEGLGEQLVLLYDGATVAAQADGNRKAPIAAQALARQLVTAASPRSRDRRSNKKRNDARLGESGA